MTAKMYRGLMIGLGFVALVILGAVYIWAPVCSGLLELADGRLIPMRCLYTAKAATILALLLLVQVISSVVGKRDNPFMVIALGIMFVAITFESFMGIGICRRVMECHDTAFWLRAGGAVVIIVGLLTLIKPKQE